MTESAEMGGMTESADNKLADAVLKSTRQYLRFLDDQGLGVERHRASDIQPMDAGQQLFEGAVWYSYSCELPPGLRIRPDTAATLALEDSAATTLEIRILRYDRQSGATQFAAREPLSCSGGAVVVDFRWLIRRCLDWYTQRGSSICHITSIADPIPPPNLPGRAAGLSSDQEAAITTALSSSLSYVWGPPGTGKTRWVLAKAVHACVSHGEKALVLAPTNTAVDNALSAIIEDGVDRQSVLRLGTPSAEFIARYPECCEERAFRSEIAQIASQLRSLGEQIARVREAENLRGAARDLRAALAGTTSAIAEMRTRLGSVGEVIAAGRAGLERQAEMLTPLERKLEARRGQLEDLGLSRVKADIETLELEQTNAVREKGKRETDLSSLGFFARVFSRREQKLQAQIGDLDLHLRAIEDTLASRRKKRDEIQPVAEALQAEAASLDAACMPGRTAISELQKRVSELESESADLASRVAVGKASLLTLEEHISVLEERLGRLDTNGVQHEDDAGRAMAGLLAEKARLEAQLAELKQSMAAKSVLGMTLDGFVGTTLQMGLSADRVFVDEAPFAPLAKLIPLLSLRRPITMLGDHLQLPPVCECENSAVICAYWAKPAIFIESAFALGEDWPNLNALERPDFAHIQQAILRTSYRFGHTLAALLDRHVYGSIGLTGCSPSDTFIECRDCEPEEVRGRQKRENHAEAEAIVGEIQAWWESANGSPDAGTLAVLTPYKNQAKLIRRRLRERISDTAILNCVEVLHTHQAQGREWDSVLFSVTDTGRLKRNEPWFTDSRRPEARALLNTTISRAKQRVIVFLDLDYWRSLPYESLIADVARSSAAGGAPSHHTRCEPEELD